METRQEVINRMLESIDNSYDKTPGFFLYDLLKAVAIEIENQSGHLDSVTSKLDVENLQGEELFKFVEQRTGITRKPAIKATTEVIISGQEGSKISKGDLVGAETINFVVTEDKTIDSTGQTTVQVECESPGSLGNVPAGAIKYFPVSIAGLTSVTNTEPITNGYNAESDESLLERYYERIRTPATSGNRYHYLNWAKEVIGVGNARVIPLWAGDNTVKVTIIGSNMQPASAELVSQVQEYIDPNISGLGEGQAPIGAFCTVTSATGKAIDITFTVTRDINYTVEQIKANVENNIKEYLREIAFKDDTVSYAKIGAIILNSDGVLDYTDLKVNNGISNIAIGNEEVAVLGQVVINE